MSTADERLVETAAARTANALYLLPHEESHDKYTETHSKFHDSLDSLTLQFKCVTLGNLNKRCLTGGLCVCVSTYACE